MDLPAVLILIITYQIINGSLCCSYKYNWWYDVNVDAWGKLYEYSAFNNPDKCVWNMYNFAWNIWD